MSTPLRILHVLSDWKWTGPAEPSVDLAAALQARGHRVFFACEQPPHAVADSVGQRLAARGIPAVAGLELRKHFKLGANLRDLWRMPALIQEHAIDVVHCHRGQDHLVAGIAVRRRKLPVAVVRTSYDGVPLRRTLRNRYLLRRCTTRLITLSQAAAAGDRAAFGLTAEQTAVVDAPVDLQRFDPARRDTTIAQARAALGIPDDAIVAGIVARMQRRRRFDVLLEAFRRAHAAEPRLRLLMLGRGTHQESVVYEPVRRLGLQDAVILPGYRGGEDFVDGVRAFDWCTFLVPGTDGSCRALRQAMALGKPGCVSRRGMLPEIVTDGLDGLVADDEPEPLAAAFTRLAGDADARRRMGDAARATALARFDAATQAAAVEAVYRDAVASVRAWS